MSEEFLHGFPSDQIDQLRLVVLFVDQQMPRVHADANRGWPRIKLHSAFKLSRHSVVDVNRLRVVYGDQPVAVGGTTDVLDPVLLSPVAYELSVYAPGLYTVLLVQ